MLCFCGLLYSQYIPIKDQIQRCTVTFSVLSASHPLVPIVNIHLLKRGMNI